MFIRCKVTCGDSGGPRVFILGRALREEEVYLTARLQAFRGPLCPQLG